MTVLLIAAALIAAAVAFAVPRLRRASQHVDAIRWEFQHSTQTPAPPATDDSKENPAA
jgi:hypothetical protein